MKHRQTEKVADHTGHGCPDDPTWDPDTQRFTTDWTCSDCGFRTDDGDEMTEHYSAGNGWCPVRYRTHCPQGHEFTPDNTLVFADGARRCRRCKSARKRAYQARQKENAK